MFFNLVFWNTDKPVNQKLTADDIAFKLELFGEKQLTVDYINSFLTEFLKKWAKIDFLRLDKYIMLVQTVMKKFFEVCLEYKNLDV
jgi:ribosomal RNA-processing protein 1